MKHAQRIGTGIGIWMTVYFIDWLLHLFCIHILPHFKSDLSFYGSVLLVSLSSFYVVGWLFRKDF